MDSIPPVVRGEFHYRDVLLVDVGGDLKRHPRASESELKALLSGKNVKDQVGHWWEAQLIHYGLPRSKQKDTAKVRLQQALSQGKLKAQPPHLADMEGQMKREYAAAVRKATKPKVDAGKGVKRAREDGPESSSKKTKISVRVGDVSFDIDHSDTTSTTKPRANARTSTAKVTKANRNKGTASKVPATSSTAKNNKKQAESAPFSDENVFQRATPISKTATKPKPKSAPVKKAPGVKQEAGALESSSAPYALSPVKREGYLFDADAMDTRADLAREKLEITGVYTIQCPQIAEQLPDKQDSLRLFMCVDNETSFTWGAFELAMKSGVIKMDDIDFGRKLSFGWRARDSWDHTLRFGQTCFGEIEFDGSGGVNGIFYGMFNEPCGFTGRRRPGPLWSGKSAYKYKQEWDAFPREAYGPGD